MWRTLTTIFSGLYILMCYYIGHRGWHSIARTSSQSGKIAFWCVYAALVLLFPLAEMGEGFSGAWGLDLRLLGGYSMVGILYLFLIVLCIDLIRLVDRHFRFIPGNISGHAKTPLVLGASAVLLTIVVVLYGIFSANNPVVIGYSVSIDKKAGALEELNVVMVSDIHYGSVVTLDRVNEMVQMINSLKPDIVLIPGDIVDGSLRPGESERLSRSLSNLQSKLGTYAVAGNHDRVLRDTNSDLSRAFRDAGISVLRDNHVRVADSFYIVGRDDRGMRNDQSRKPLGELVRGLDPSLPLILLDHQPVDLENAQKHKVDLQLSGHTHRGQVFPANLLTGLIYELSWGLLKKDGYHLIVSSGYGIWGPALRIGSRAEIVQVRVKFGTQRARVTGLSWLAPTYALGTPSACASRPESLSLWH